ncbi:hypothetical protein [Eoetvoesiella caeni]|uniref:Uncharacterized protein n=1 Tax=Eoetvoesiella caeni TaxID=645616 RepID=A0A366HM02_9BURK|nr:hypothetical protein [Eoetvoesiella caeni]MCI2807607.1 hypothetical protein [Eoetvoesiella caeni]NYT52998.1 hypothetical protein [Eoetvoesiella caeni]RBP42975.1 hypothetical protein DFR37_101100 [Eoetvoesiella caeni]
MTQAKIEPGRTNLSPAGKPKGDGGERKSDKEKDWLPELGLKSPAKEKGKQTDASPLDPGIDLRKD